MNQQLPVTIYKHWIGYVAIFFGGLGVLGLVLWGLYEAFQTPFADPLVMMLIATLCVALVVAVVAVMLRQYSLSYLMLTSDGVVAVNWLTLFAKNDVQAEWFRIQDVSVVTGSIFGLLIGYGTLNIQTAGSYQNIRMTMVPNAADWQKVIAEYADKATQDGMDLSTTTSQSA